MKPFLKWAGGKRQLLPYINDFINSKNLEDCTYYEPFVGGGSVFLNLNHNNVVINDCNKEIINTYKVIKSNPKKLIKLLKILKEKHSKEFYYFMRSLDRDVDSFNKMSNVEKAARTIYLNRTCYNGLYRVNKQGFFNTPIGRYVNPLICDEENIYEVHNYLVNNDVKILSLDFEKSVECAKKGDWIYFDPPYDYENTGFVNYNKDGFTHDDLVRLKKICDDLILRGCKVLISNNDTAFVRELFCNNNYYKIVYQTHVIQANRNINSKGSKRKKVDEVLIYGEIKK